ncbi:MAG: WD40 repeat domain-containing protein [Dehalococcoidia bacterium]
MATQLYVFANDTLRSLDAPAARPLRWAAWHGDRCLLAGNGGAALLYDGKRFQAIDTGTKQNLRGAAFSPDGSEALLAGNRGIVLHMQGSHVRPLASPTHENLRRAAWHPDGDFALIVGNGGTVLRYQDGALTPVPGDRAHTLRTLAWRPDGAYALVGAYASRYAGYPRPHALYKCDGLYLQALLTSDEEDDFVAVDWHPDGSHALIAGYAYDSKRGTFANKVLSYDGSGFSYRAVEASGALLGGAWHPGGDYALLCGEGGTLLRYTVSGSVEQIESGTDDNLVGPFWAPDGSLALLLRGPSERVYTV